MKYRKKPVEIEARQFTDSRDWMDVVQWCGGALGSDGRLEISTLEGVMKAEIDDWIIRGVQGEFYPCKPDIFEATYEAVP